MQERYITLKEIRDLVHIDFLGENHVIRGLNLCNRITNYSSIISYITSSKFFDSVVQNKAIQALMLTPKLYLEIKDILAVRDISYFLVENPEISFYSLHQKLWQETIFYNKYDFEPVIGKDCKIHSSVVIEKGVVIRDYVTIGPNSVIRAGSIIDDGVSIGCCSVIGSEGYQAIKGFTGMIKHVGQTHLCKNVWVGDNTTIGNALFEGSTLVGENSKIDNHVHFAHNCTCGKDCYIIASSLLMGSSTLENDVWLAPNSVILNQKIVKNNGYVGTLSFVNKDVEEGAVVVGIPAKRIK